MAVIDSNFWLGVKKARTIAQFLNQKYRGRVVHEDEILDDMWGHHLYLDEMWLNVHWRNDDSVDEIEIGYERYWPSGR